MSRHGTDAEILARLYAASAEFLQARDWRPMRPDRPGGDVLWAHDAIPGFHGLKSATSVEWERMERDFYDGGPA